jgi:hypothetical protein
MKIHGIEYFKIITHNSSYSGVWIETYETIETHIFCTKV